jgi:hypothetical protein
MVFLAGMVNVKEAAEEVDWRMALKWHSLDAPVIAAPNLLHFVQFIYAANAYSASPSSLHHRSALSCYHKILIAHITPYTPPCLANNAASNGPSHLRFDDGWFFRRNPIFTDNSRLWSSCTCNISQASSRVSALFRRNALWPNVRRNQRRHEEYAGDIPV